MPQTDFSQDVKVGVAGSIVDTQPHNIVTYSTAVELAFGRVVSLADDVGNSVGEATDTKLAGVTVAVAKGRPLAESASYRVGDAVAVMKQGYVYMVAQGAVVAGDKVFVINSVADKKGLVGSSATAGGGTGNAELLGAVFATGGADGELVQVSLNLA